MASNEAVIKVRVDTQQGKRDVRGLEQEFDRATASAGRTGAAMGLGLGRLAGLATGALGIAAFGRGTIRDARDVGSALTLDASEQLAQLLLGDAGARARGLNTALNDTLNTFGGAVGAGADPEAARRFFDAISPIHVSEERGKQRIRQQLGPELRKAMVEALGEQAGNIAQQIGEAVRGALDGVARLVK